MALQYKNEEESKFTIKNTKTRHYKPEQGKTYHIHTDKTNKQNKALQNKTRQNAPYLF